jgi:hypothetical protein
MPRRPGARAIVPTEPRAPLHPLFAADHGLIMILADRKGHSGPAGGRPLTQRAAEGDPEEPPEATPLDRESKRAAINHWWSSHSIALSRPGLSRILGA